jgi:hypothetical protein
MSIQAKVAKPDASAMASPGTLGSLNREFGFKTGISGAHTARTLMLPDLVALLRAAPADANREVLSRLIIENNALGKRTASNRWLTARHLTDLYGLDPSITLFRLLRFFWDTDPPARPMLALLCAHGRDALLRRSARKVLDARPGDLLVSGDFANFFSRELPNRFSDAMTLSLAQNVAASWAQAGFLRGKVRKARTRAVATPAAAAYALALGYLCGLQGQRLIEGDWARLLDVPRERVVQLAQEASKRNWLDFKGAGNVFEIGFRQLLTPRELQLLHGPN